MKHSEEIAELAKALVAFQGEVMNPKNTSENSHFKSKYAPLSEVLNVVRPLLAKHGLCVVQSPCDGNNGTIVIATLLIHTSGQWLEADPLVLKPEKMTPQGAGSAITYGRRYTLSALLALSSEDDDDGNRASAGGEALVAPARQAKGQETAKPASTKHSDVTVEGKVDAGKLKTLVNKATKSGMSESDLQGLVAWKYGLTAKEDLSLPQFVEFYGKLDAFWQQYVGEQSAAS